MSTTVADVKPVAQASRPPARAEQARPNILFIAVDDLRPELGVYGAPEAKTPNIDAIAAQGVRFDRAYVSYPLCLPSRASLMSGVRVDNSRVNGVEQRKPEFVDFLQGGDTWPRILSKAGYWTATHGKVYHGSVPRIERDAFTIAGEHWIDGVQDWSPEIRARMVASGGDKAALEEFFRTGKGGGSLVWVSIDGPDELLNDGKVAALTIKQLRERPKDKPFMIAAGFSRPHMPWVAPKKYFDLYPEFNSARVANPPEGIPRQVRKDDIGGVSGTAIQWNEGVSDTEAQALVRGYLASTSYVDAQIGEIMRELDAQGLRDNTLVIVWGDHGYHLTEHGLWRKNTPYHVSLRNPLIIAGPGVDQGKRVDNVVESIDIYPTLMAATGLTGPSRIEGRDLAPLLSGQEVAWTDEAYTSARGRYGMVTDRYRFTLDRDHRPESLFDLQADPDEWNNLVDARAYDARVKEFTAKVKQRWKLK